MEFLREKQIDKIIAFICIVVSLGYIITGAYFYLTGQIDSIIDTAGLVIVCTVSLLLFMFCGLAVFLTSYVAVRRFKKAIAKNGEVK